MMTLCCTCNRCTRPISEDWMNYGRRYLASDHYPYRISAASGKGQARSEISLTHYAAKQYRADVQVRGRLEVFQEAIMCRPINHLLQQPAIWPPVTPTSSSG